MTVIAWDGRTLAADKMTTWGNLPRMTTKVHQVPDGIVAFCGSSARCAAMLQWFRGGRQVNDWPRAQTPDENAFSFFVDWSGQPWIYEEVPHPIRIENPRDAMGSGSREARAAMHLGLDAISAIKVASELVTDCGLGVDFINLQDARDKRTQMAMF